MALRAAMGFVATAAAGPNGPPAHVLDSDVLVHGVHEHASQSIAVRLVGRARVISSAVGLVPACRELLGLWPVMAHIGDGRCVEHLPAQFLPTAEPSPFAPTSRLVGMTFRTFVERLVGSAAV